MQRSRSDRLSMGAAAVVRSAPDKRAFSADPYREWQSAFRCRGASTPALYSATSEDWSGSRSVLVRVNIWRYRRRLIPNKA
jgi:hypothetical protein